MELKILVVDDEEIIRKGIKTKIERLLPHVKVVGTAQDASEGLEMVKEYRPNIVVTDIRMPETDGLQFIEMARKINSRLKFVIVSGYQDFEYARKALCLGANEYLLKPVENEQLKAILTQLESTLETESSRDTELAALKSQARNGTDYLKNKYLNDLTAHVNDFDVKHITNNLEILGIVFDKRLYTVLNLIILPMDNSFFSSTREDISLAKFAVRNILEELLSPAGLVVTFEHLKEDNQVAVIINHDKALTAAEGFDLHAACGSIVYSINKYLKLSVSLGIGKSYDSIRNVPDSYIESFTAAIQKITMGENKVISFDQLPDSSRIDFFLHEESKLLLINYIKEGNHKKAQEIVGKIFNDIKKQNLTYSNIKLLYIDLMLLFSRTVKESGGSWDKIFREDIFSEKWLVQYSTLDSLYMWLKECILGICSYLENLTKSHGKKVIDEIREFINNYYYTDISLNDMANKYYLNPNYLSQLFKTETGENFIDYLTKVRMDKAKDLLINTDLKALKVAEMVGYPNPRYFSEVFQKYFGSTPTEFRKCKE
ncbi:MAG: response regulator [Clostridia bacterium]|nr:response regulator [Clostridia bacterium]